MNIELRVSRVAREPLSIHLSAGKCLFVLGANGAGKSSLMGSFYRANSQIAVRISAHRQTWMPTNAVDMSGRERRQVDEQMKHRDKQAESRWRDDMSNQRANVAIYDLIDAENVRAREIAKAVDGDDIEVARSVATKRAPIARINELMRSSNMPIEISVQANEQLMASKNGGATYSVAELSDGERNALLLGAAVLCAAPGTLILVDEPERHIHRSISSPLLSSLFAARSDCAFVTSTHDLSLPYDHVDAQALLLRECHYNGPNVAGWDADIMPGGLDVDDDLRLDVMGARRRVLFVEGVLTSLDARMFAAVFPGVSILCKAGCREVERAVAGVRGCTDLHWLEAYGVVDNDGRGTDDLSRLEGVGVYSMSVHAIEAIYYDARLRAIAAARMARVTKSDSGEAIARASQAILDAVRPHVDRLSRRVAEKQVREQVLAGLPTRRHLDSGGRFVIEVDIDEHRQRELARLQSMLDRREIDAIVARYPIRETPALNECAKALGYTARDQYEAAVRAILFEDTEACGYVRKLFGELASKLGFEAASVPVDDAADGASCRS